MADVKSAQALLMDLPKNDHLKSLQELTDWIESVSAREDYRIIDQLAVLNLLDETAQPHVRKLTCEYFTLPDMHAFHGNRLCMALGNFSRTMFDAYCLMFDRCEGGASSLLVVRAVRLLCEKLKYMAVNYQTQDENAWRNFARLYRHAESQGCAGESLSIYPSIQTTIQKEAGKLLAWHALGITSLSPRSMHLAELILARNSDAITVAKEPGSQDFCSFDLSSAQPPLRMLPDAKQSPGMRYVGLSAMQARFEAMIRVLEKDVVPEAFSPGCPYAAEWVLEAARHVLNQAVFTPQRATKRREMQADLFAVFGCESLLRLALGNEVEEMQMRLLNASPGGFYSELSGKGADRVRIGHVFGVKTSGGLGVYIVRRLSRDADGRLHAGAEMLTAKASVVSLAGAEQLLLHAEEGIATLLMQADVFSMQRSLKASFDGRNYLLMPVKLLESGLDYDLASFRMIEQEEE